MAKTQTTEANAAAFTKAQLVASQRYVHRRDLIGALLEDGKTYTLNEVDALTSISPAGKGHPPLCLTEAMRQRPLF